MLTSKDNIYIDFKDRKFNASITSSSIFNETKRELISKEGTTDDKELALERYKEKPSYVDSISSDTLSEIVRSNKYARVNFKHRKLTLTELPFYSSNNYNNPFEVIGTQDQDNIFLVNGIPSILLRSNNDLYYNGKTNNLFDICDSYKLELERNGLKAGKVILDSIYFKSPITCDVYTKNILDEESNSNYVYLDSRLSSNPVYFLPFRRTFKIKYPKAYDKVEIDGVVIERGKVVSLVNEFAKNKNIYITLVDNDIRMNITIDYFNGDYIKNNFKIRFWESNKWSDLYDFTDYIVFDESINKNKNNIDVTIPEVYYTVPFTLEMSLTPGVQLPNNKLNNCKLIFNEEEIILDPIFISQASGVYKYRCEDVILKQAAKNDLEFKVIYDDVISFNGITGYIWGNGFSKVKINPVPENYIEVTILNKDDWVISEAKDFVKTYTLKTIGTLTIDHIKINYLKDTNQYFDKDDFIVSYGNNKITLKTNKIFDAPNKESSGVLSFNFDYMCKRKDGEIVRWPSGLIDFKYNIIFDKERYLIEIIEVDNVLIGDTNVYFKIKDKLTDKYTDIYSESAGIRLSGNSTYHDKTEKLISTNPLIWDNRRYCWFSKIILNSYGKIGIGYVEKYRVSKVQYIEHNEPVLPFKLTPKTNLVEYNKTTRIIADISYTEEVNDVYIDGYSIGNNTLIPINDKLEKVKHHNSLISISPIKDPKNLRKIVALGLDITSIGKIGGNIKINVTQVNYMDYSKWNNVITIPYTVIKLEGPNITLETKEFKTGNNKVLINVNNKDSYTAIVNAKLMDGNNIISRPSFKPLGMGKYESNDFNIPSSYFNKELTLDLEIINYNFYNSNETPIQEISLTNFKVKATK